MKKISMSIYLVYIMLFMTSLTVFAEKSVKAPPLPLQNVEGFGGILITGSAYLINPSEKGKVFGLPSWGVTYANIGHGRHLEAYTVSETIWGRLELGYALNHFHLGDLPRDIRVATGINTINDSVYMHNFNARLQLLKEGDFKKSWIPSLTLGLHYKKNEDNDGVDVTLFASKMINPCRDLSC